MTSVLTGAHRDRLRAAGAEASSLDGTSWSVVTDGLPQWWHDCGNALYLAERAWLPEHVIASLGLFPVRDVLIVVSAPMEWLCCWSAEMRRPCSWAANVYLATDDMHRLRDRDTGERINPFGADIRLGRHVWLGRDAVVTGHAEIGEGAVVGMRSLVRGQKVPAFTVAAGSPARIVREGVTWSHDDVP
jgi:hypothetical protein